ncbi:MAG: alpha-amylase family glycosyl hydrolase [Chloroflexota bacterium]|nr:alpha-amylase family glycosyl hydrolase [Chloroflexota bacterium]
MTSGESYLWWQTGVIYQVYPRSFKDTTGNGVGDLRGIIEELDYLSDTLGVDAIWLSPFYPSPMADFGYDVSDYTDVDPLFGDLDTFDELVTRAHRRGLRVLIDLVPNHTSDRHPWFIESRSTRDNPSRDWYIWADPQPDGSPPNNWLSVFGGSAWEWDEITEQYYLHSFLKEQPDLNWRNPEVRDAMFEVVRFWLERGVDGFRIDVAHHIMKDLQLRDNPLDAQRARSIHRPMGDYDSQFHKYDCGHPDVHDVYREFRQILDSYNHQRPRVSIGEIHIFDWEEWVSYYGENLDELHMPFNFALLNVNWDAQAVRDVVDSLEVALPEGAWPNYVLGNHDEPRLTSRYGRDGARVAAMLLLTLRGTPTLYYGDEIGMVNVPVPPERRQDPWSETLPHMGRDPCRTPMQWSGEPNAGFSPAWTPELWLPLADDYETMNVARELEEPTSILNLYRRLLAYRKATPALMWGRYAPIDGVAEACYAFLRQTDEQRILVALNFSDQQQDLTLPAGGGTIAVSTHLDRTGSIDPTALSLRGNEGLIIELTSSSS